MKIVKLVFILLIFQTALFAKHKLYVNILDIDNTTSFEEFYSNKLIDRFRYKDIFMALDSKTMQYIGSIEFDREDVNRYKKKRIFINKFERGMLKKFENKSNSEFNTLKEENILNSEKNDFARQLKVVSKIVSAYKDKYDIKVIFFGNSYLHNAYNHDFSKGIPTDGFIYLDDSEFNSFADIDASNVQFAIMYDDEPPFNKNRYFRFYKKLFKKKFNATLATFNDTATFGAEENLKYDDKDFKKSVIAVVQEKKQSDCAEHDKVRANYIENKAVIKVEIDNICRKDSLVSFYHNGIAKQIVLDKNGKGSVEFKAVLGKNFIDYHNLNGDKIRIFEQDIKSPDNDIEFIPNFATKEVTIKGYNPLRGDDSQVKIYYKTTGSYIYMDVKDGHFETTVPIDYGDNIFEWKDLNGKDHSKNIRFDEKCTDKVEVDTKYAQEYGIAKIKLHNECREDGSQVKFFYNDNTYTSMIVKGDTKIWILLDKDINDIYYEDFNKNRQKAATIKIKDFKDLIRYAISYKDNVIAIINVFEPNINIDSTKEIEGIDYTDKSQYREGHLHCSNTKSKSGTILMCDIPATKNYLSDKFIKVYQQIYVTRKKNQPKGYINFYIDYFSRHGRYATDKLGKKGEPLCGKRSLGGMVVDYQILYNGVIEKSKKFLNPARCKKDVNDGKLKPQLADHYLTFIKKVEIK